MNVSLIGLGVAFEHLVIVKLMKMLKNIKISLKMNFKIIKSMK